MSSLYVGGTRYTLSYPFASVDLRRRHRLRRLLKSGLGIELIRRHRSRSVRLGHQQRLNATY
jgi:hypothetical protein